MPPYVLCAVIESNMYSTLTCRIEELDASLQMITGNRLEVFDVDLEIKIHFKYLTAQEYHDLPDWSP